MNRLKTEIAHENRVNMEVESWLKDRNTYLTSLHHFWTKKLNEDVPAKEAELQKLKDARNRDRKAYLDAKERIEVAEKFIGKFFYTCIFVEKSCCSVVFVRLKLYSVKKTTIQISSRNLSIRKQRS